MLYTHTFRPPAFPPKTRTGISGCPRPPTVPIRAPGEPPKPSTRAPARSPKRRRPQAGSLFRAIRTSSATSDPAGSRARPPSFPARRKRAKGHPDYASGRLSLYANRGRPDGLHHPSPGRTAARNGLPIAWTFFYPRGPFPKRMTGQKSCRAEGAAPRKPGTVIPLRIRSAMAWGTAR